MFIDLKNAFGEVHHNLIYEVLDYHHVPNHIKNLICSLYTDFQTSIITEQFNTPFITVGRGVLQGNCLSPLLFNMSFNTFIQHIKSEKYRQLGFWKLSEIGIPCNPIHWFQFADDAAVISSQEKENQMLLNRFTIWCQWANMIIRVDKCSTFGIKKHLTKSIQYLPKLFVNNDLVPRTKMGKSFRYLGRYFDFNMSDEEHRSELLDVFNDIMNKINELPLHPKNKILLYSRYLLSKISWDLTVSDISKTWICETLDSIATKYIRKWLELPVSATLSNVLLPQNKFGLNIILPSTKFIQCQTVSRSALKYSPNVNINNLWAVTSTNKNIQYDIYKDTKDVLKAVRKENEQRLQNHLISQELTRRVSSTSDCSFCSSPETLFHVIAGCKTYLDEGRFTWRHDSVLNFLASTLTAVKNSTLYADIPGFMNPSVITGDRLRPDFLLVTENRCLYILELTVGYESNLLVNANRKRQKYRDLINEQEADYDKFKTSFRWAVIDGVVKKKYIKIVLLTQSIKICRLCILLSESQTPTTLSVIVVNHVKEIDVLENIASDQNFPVLKKGVKLPKSDAEWSTADSYFKSEL
ncbi:Hypothetical predicted protein [Paramuricea clavata]|uniref:Uncharacterized protein n=1 Tax=Paramuricea clavata TaxID=317549 RepID=A0A7D9IIF4_PARCT|nr:Hypothetical predicted protein [Paramuricea clavata]